MEEHPPLFSSEELNGLEKNAPVIAHENVIPFQPQTTLARETLVPVFNPAEVVTGNPPQHEGLPYAEAVAKYKEMIGQFPSDDLSEEAINKAISSVDAAQDEHYRLLEIARKEDAEEIKNLYSK